MRMSETSSSSALRRALADPDDVWGLAAGLEGSSRTYGRVKPFRASHRRSGARASRKLTIEPASAVLTGRPCQDGRNPLGQ
jgi:hypothetical protein